MSVSVLTGSKEPFLCELCGKPLTGLERCYVALRTDVLYFSGYTIEDSPQLDPDCNWFTALDYDRDLYFHTWCLSETIYREKLAIMKKEVQDRLKE